MGFRFQKRIKLMPGVTLNVSKSGVTTSVGTRDARVTVGRGKVRKTVGLPGSGVSHTSVRQATPNKGQATVWVWIVVVAVVLVVLAGALK